MVDVYAPFLVLGRSTLAGVRCTSRDYFTYFPNHRGSLRLKILLAQGRGKLDVSNDNP